MILESRTGEPVGADSARLVLCDPDGLTHALMRSRF